MYDLTAILANTSEYGFVFVEDEVSTNEGDVSLGKGPILTVQDVAKFETHFPGRITAMLDGSSARVISQRVIREARKKDSRIKSEDLQPRVLNAIMGVKTRTPLTVKVYALPDGSTTQDLAAFKAAWGIEE